MGDTLIYAITIKNNGNADATNVRFGDIPDENTRLINGTVQGPAASTITEGNVAGETNIVVELGTIPICESV